MKPPIVVVGSSNTDMVIRTAHLPAPGETILGGKFLMNAGGKGANQAVAAARLGGRVVFIGKTGDDIFGRQSLEHFSAEGIDTTYMATDPENPSGVALITVDDHGENCIAVASGANGTLNTADLDLAKDIISQSSILLVQLEIPLEAVAHAVRLASRAGATVILNPAPARALPDELLRDVTVITPNKTEAEMLTGVAILDGASAEKAARQLAAKGIQTVIITLGPAGALLLHQNVASMIPAKAVQALDTTAAGDIFNGALAVALADQMDLPAAVSFGCAAAAISVTRLGAQSSAPFLSEIDPLLFTLSS